MKKILLNLLVCLSVSASAQNVGIGTNTPKDYNKLEISSTESGFQLPKMTTAQRATLKGNIEALSTTLSLEYSGMMVYDLTNNTLYMWDASKSTNGDWVNVLDSDASINDADADATNEIQTINANNGLTGGGSGLTINLGIGAGDAITVNANDIDVNVDGTEIIINGSNQLEIGNIPSGDTDYIHNQNTIDQSADFRINGTGQQNKIIATANNDWFLRGGDDAEFRDVNITNTLGIWGITNSDKAGIQLGSDGSYIFGDDGNIGIGTSATLDSKLVVAGDIDFNNNAILSDRIGTTNIDHIWHDDGDNAWHMVSDGTYKQTGNTELYVDQVHMPGNVVYSQNRGTYGHDNSNSGYRTTGVATNSLDVKVGDVITILHTSKFRWPGGSGSDHPYYGMRVAGCANTSVRDVEWLGTADDNPRGQWQVMASNYVWVATCNGTVTFQLEVDNNSQADDNSEYRDIVIIATKY